MSFTWLQKAVSCHVGFVCETLQRLLYILHQSDQVAGDFPSNALYAVPRILTFEPEPFSLTDKKEPIDLIGMPFISLPSATLKVVSIRFRSS